MHSRIFIVHNAAPDVATSLSASLGCARNSKLSEFRGAANKKERSTREPGIRRLSCTDQHGSSPLVRSNRRSSPPPSPLTDIQRFFHPTRRPKPNLTARLGARLFEQSARAEARMSPAWRSRYRVKYGREKPSNKGPPRLRKYW